MTNILLDGEKIEVRSSIRVTTHNYRRSLNSRVDNIIPEIIWKFRQSDLNEKRKLAKRSASQNFEDTH
jgi:hypothetical protein